MTAQEGTLTAHEPVGRRRYWCPQVVQTSNMDCGPAAVKALLEGFGVSAAYGRLREACQTDVDGTAIGALEDLIGQLGLEVEQVMEPVDHVLASRLPAIVVVLTGTGHTHYVVAWRRHGGRIQVMDPATGRRFLSSDDFERSLYRHQHGVEASAWREWAGTEAFTGPLRKRLERLGADVGARLGEALADASWLSLAALDAATRLVAVLVERGGVIRGREADSLLQSLAARAVDEVSAGGQGPTAVPERFWSVWPDGKNRLWLRGAVLLRVTGVRPSDESPAPGPVSEPMLRAIQIGDRSPWRLLLSLIRHRGRQLLAATTVGASVASLLVALEALLLLGLIRAADQLDGLGQLPAAIGLGITFVMTITALELAVATGVRHLGRDLEIAVRTAFLRKIPRLEDRYFESRLRSDMAERAHSVVGLRQLPAHLSGLAASAAGLVGTAGALALFFPDVAWLAVFLAVLSVAIPFAARPLLQEQAATLRTHGGALAGFYLDGLRGLTAIRAQRAETSLRGEHQNVLDRWLTTALSFNLRVVTVDFLQALAGVVLAAAMVFEHTAGHGLGGGVLLLTYWALALPALGASFALGVEQLPNFRSIAARFAEPIEAPEEETSAEFVAPAERSERGVSLRFEGVSVVAGGHQLLRGVEAKLEPGERVAVLGASGAGKSTFLGLLLGWHRPASGRVLVEGAALDGDLLAELRADTAWVDPAVTLWNRPLLDNLRYGAKAGEAEVEAVCRAADLREVIASLPSGLATALGEEGGRLAGGEAQRVRMARALGRRSARLVVLDEPFRGLERERRQELLEQALRWWRGATVLCATHDLAMASLFDRVAVIHEGELVELDTPTALRTRTDSHYSRLLERESRREELWRSIPWQRMWMEGGRLTSGVRPGDRE